VSGKTGMASDNQNELTVQGTGDVAIIGEGTQNRTEFPIQVLQNIYHEITGKQEDISKSYTEAFQIELSDIEQLHLRITQALEQYNLCAINSGFKIYYANDSHDSYSSFDRFKSFGTGANSPTESVFLKYDFMFVLPKVKSTQCYTVTLRLASRITIEKKMRRDLPFDVPKILRLMGGRTGVLAIKYVDYAVARTMLHTVDEWFSSLHKSEEPAAFNYIRARSEYLPIVARYFAGLFVTWAILARLSDFLSATATAQDLARFGLCAWLGISVACKVAHHLGKMAERSLDDWSPLSYVSLNSGDKKEISEAKTRNDWKVITASIKFASSLLMSLISKVIIWWILPAK
jgi:hypothetical protein